MRATFALISILLVLVTGCGKDGGQSSAGGDSDPSSATASGALEQMRADIEALNSQAEQAAKKMTVQHILISFAGANPRVPATRSREEAEQLSADLYRRVTSGEDFRNLMGEYSQDSGGGVYTMVTDPSLKTPSNFMRSGMAPSFGDVAWRLDVNDVGVAPHDPQKSPFGWHIIQRIE